MPSTTAHLRPAILRWRLVPIVPVGLGVLVSLMLLARLQADVFFSGDAGLKWLMVEQYARGDFSVVLSLEKPEWIEALWRDGLYPFAPPFVYATSHGKIVAFPFLFQLLSAPFYRVFGMAGLYIIPVIALWLIWWRCLLLCRRLQLQPGSTLVAVTGLVLGAPLLLYGVMFWEHTLAVLLAFLGLEFYLHHTTCSRLKAILLGILTALSGWLRPEAMLFVALLGMLLAVRYLRTRQTSIGYFLAGAAATLGLLFWLNTVLFGHVLGAHGFQVVQQSLSVSSRLIKATIIWKGLQDELLRTFPLAAFALLAAPLLLFRRKNGALIGLLLLVVGYYCVVPFLLPNFGGKQWGPRYLLILLPSITVLIAYEVEALTRISGRAGRALAWTLLLLCLGAGLFMNLYEGPRRLLGDYDTRVRPALDELRRSDIEYIAVNSQYIAQELAVLHDYRTFFLVRSEPDLRVLTRGLRAHGVRKMLYLTEGPPLVSDRPLRVDDNIAVAFEYAGRFGSYSFAEGSLSDWSERR